METEEIIQAVRARRYKMQLEAVIEKRAEVPGQTGWWGANAPTWLGGKDESSYKRPANQRDLQAWQKSPAAGPAAKIHPAKLQPVDKTLMGRANRAIADMAPKPGTWDATFSSLDPTGTYDMARLAVPSLYQQGKQTAQKELGDITGVPALVAESEKWRAKADDLQDQLTPALAAIPELQKRVDKYERLFTTPEGKKELTTSLGKLLQQTAESEGGQKAIETATKPMEERVQAGMHKGVVSGGQEIISEGQKKLEGMSWETIMPMLLVALMGIGGAGMAFGGGQRLMSGGGRGYFG